MEYSEDNQESIEILNDLIQINNDRIAGYEKAVDNTSTADGELKTLYTRMIEESYEYNRELSEKVIELGGEPTNDTTNSGKLYRAWMDVKATFTGHDAKSTLAACEFGEDAAQKAYEKALEEDSALPMDISNLIARQKSLLNGSHHLVKQYRDQYAEV